MYMIIPRRGSSWEVFRTGDGGASYDQVAKLTASDGALDDRFSAFLAIEGGTVVIGASWAEMLCSSATAGQPAAPPSLEPLR